MEFWSTLVTLPNGLERFAGVLVLGVKMLLAALSEVLDPTRMRESERASVGGKTSFASRKMPGIFRRSTGSAL